MRYVRKLMLLAVVAIAALAMTAASASAVEVTNETDAEHCSAVVPAQHEAGSGGCEIGAASEGSDIELGSPLGMIDCANTFEARVDEAGAGYIYDQALTSCSPLPVTPCMEGSETENWPVQLTAVDRMEASFCVDINPFVQGSRCHLPDIHVQQISHQQVEFFTEGHQPCEQPGYSVSGHWIANGSDTGPHPEVEISE